MLTTDKAGLELNEKERQMRKAGFVNVTGLTVSTKIGGETVDFVVPKADFFESKTFCCSREHDSRTKTWLIVFVQETGRVWFSDKASLESAKTPVLLQLFACAGLNASAFNRYMSGSSKSCLPLIHTPFAFGIGFDSVSFEARLLNPEKRIVSQSDMDYRKAFDRLLELSNRTFMKMMQTLFCGALDFRGLPNTVFDRAFGYHPMMQDSSPATTPASYYSNVINMAHRQLALPDMSHDEFVKLISL